MVNRRRDRGADRENVKNVVRGRDRSGTEGNVTWMSEPIGFVLPGIHGESHSLMGPAQPCGGSWFDVDHPETAVIRVAAGADGCGLSLERNDMMMMMWDRPGGEDF